MLSRPKMIRMNQLQTSGKAKSAAKSKKGKKEVAAAASASVPDPADDAQPAIRKKPAASLKRPASNLKAQGYENNLGTDSELSNLKIEKYMYHGQPSDQRAQ